MRMLNADANIIAHSGQGVLVGYSGSTNYTLPSQYPNADVIVNAQPTKWNFDNYKPQVIVVFLGTNDHAGIGKDNEFTSDNFVTAYNDFILTTYGVKSS